MKKLALIVALGATLTLATASTASAWFFHVPTSSQIQQSNVSKTSDKVDKTYANNTKG